MIRTQVYLTVQEREKLHVLSKELGLHQSSLIRQAIDQFIENKLIEKQKRGNAVQAAAGLWADRDDLPDFAQLRSEFET